MEGLAAPRAPPRGDRLLTPATSGARRDDHGVAERFTDRTAGGGRWGGSPPGSPTRGAGAGRAGCSPCHGAASRWRPRWRPPSMRHSTCSSCASSACRASPSSAWARSARTACGCSTPTSCAPCASRRRRSRDEARERAELDRRRQYRGASMVAIDGATVVIVDDGIATGGTASRGGGRAAHGVRVVVATGRSRRHGRRAAAGPTTWSQARHRSRSRRSGSGTSTSVRRPTTRSPRCWSA